MNSITHLLSSLPSNCTYSHGLLSCYQSYYGSKVHKIVADGASQIVWDQEEEDAKAKLNPSAFVESLLKFFTSEATNPSLTHLVQHKAGC